MDRFHGKYLGVVVDNDDPLAVGRVRTKVPEVTGDETTGWCQPAAVFAGPGVGFSVVPPVDALVFVEWPAGDITRAPIWSGGVWPSGEGVSGAAPDVLVIVTPGGHRVELRDTSGDAAVEITAASGATVVLDQSGVQISFGAQKLAMTQASVSINDGALQVM